MKLVSWLLLATLGTSMVFPDRAALAGMDSAQRSSIEKALELYRSFKSREDFTHSLKEELLQGDDQFLEVYLQKQNIEKLPTILLEGDSLLVGAGPETLKVKIIDVSALEVEVDGKRFAYDLDQTMQANLARMEKVFGASSASLIEFLIPSAYAYFLIIAGIIFVVGLYLFSSRKPALQDCEERYKRLQESDIRASQNEIARIDSELIGAQAAISGVCYRYGQHSEDCTNARKLESCYKKLKAETKARLRTYNGSIGREPPSVGGGRPRPILPTPGAGQGN
jgi:hypothetical protein